MGIVFGLTLAYVVRRVFTCPEGKWFAIKELFAHLYLRIQRYLRTRRFDLYDPFEAKDLFRSAVLHPEVEKQLEYRRTEPDASDIILIYGCNPGGDKLFLRLSVLDDQSTATLYLFLAETRKEYVLPQEIVYRVPKSNMDCFTAGGLRIRCLAPMRKWRVSFNGLLRESGEDSLAEHHVKFSFLWTAGSDVFDAKTDIHPDLLSNFFAHQTWDSWTPDLDKLLPYLDSYEQNGTLSGSIVIDGEDEQEMYLWGSRLRATEPIDLSNVDSSTRFLGYTKHGHSFHIQSMKFNGSPKELRFGFLVHPNFVDGKINSFQGTEEENKMQFTKEKRQFNVETLSCGRSLEFIEAFNGNRNSVQFCDLLFNGEEGIGIKYRSTSNLQPTKAPRKTDDSQANICGGKILTFLDSACTRTDLCGGKGASLAVLSQLVTHNKEFTVPKGFVVTTDAYKDFVDSSSLGEHLSHLENAVWGDANSNVQEMCQTIVERTTSCVFPENLKSELNTKFVQVFGKDYANQRYAVRSSAVGEDSEEMSAAGQMDTFLGLQGTEDVMKAIVKCWASQFSFTAVQYKRQNGQLLNSAMAVVVQEMVSPEVAGVMFTCDPVDGNPGKITIAANYGIGESVVAATAEPDTVVLKKTCEGNVFYESESIGKKKVKVVMKDGSGVREESIAEHETSKCCLSQELALQLGKIGVKIEKEFGNPMDIEWASNADHVFLLQARPVTTFDTETDFEIAHEFDTALRCEEDYNSKANVGEVMPGAMTTLGSEICMVMIFAGTKSVWIKRQRVGSCPTPYLMKGMSISQNHVLFGLLDTVLRFYDEKGTSMATNAYGVALLGRVLDDPDMLGVAVRRNKDYPPPTKLMLFYILQDIFCCGWHLRKCVKSHGSHEIDVSRCETAEAMFMKIISELVPLSKLMSIHSECTMASSMLNMILLSVLSSANGSWDENVYEDFARILATCKDVESADVPSAMQKLAGLIHEQNSSFKNLPIDDALDWLQTSGLKSSTEFDKFIKRHGHRCVKEFDVYTKPWGENFQPLVKTLQDMVGKVGPKSSAEPVDFEETLEKCNVSLDWRQRLILKLVMPRIRTVVGLREISKSLFIKIIDSFRKSVRLLASKMVSEGRLPNVDLLYFLSVNEIDSLLKTRSPKLVQKAVRRKNMHSKLDQLKFPEIMKGVPKPISDEAPVIPDGDLILKGTPVSRGIVQAKARVARSLEEASEIQSGEILIAYSTDIGWSPYFPMLSGVATELGGLISHGAVVAREYGLPCVVAVHRATQLFKTGDVVRLDGNKGVLTRVS